MLLIHRRLSLVDHEEVTALFLALSVNAAVLVDARGDGLVRDLRASHRRGHIHGLDRC